MQTAPYAPGRTTFPPGSNLNPIQYIRTEKIARVREQAVLPRISVFKGFGTCGSAMNIRHEYTSRERAQQAQHGGILKPIQIRAPKEQTFIVGDKMGTLLEFPQCDWDKIQANDPSLIQEIINFFQDDTMLSFDTKAFQEIISEADDMNRGRKAGRKSRNIDLGSQQNPLHTTAESVWYQHYAMPRVMRERGLGRTGAGMYALHGEGFMEAVARNPLLSSYYHTGACHTCSSATMGDSRMIDGIEYINTKCLPTFNDGGSLIYPILFGYKEALWSSYDTVMEYKKGGPGVDASYIEMYWHLGLKLIDPRLVGVMWVRVDPLETGGN